MVTLPRITVFDDPELAHKYASATGAKHLRVAGDERKQLAMLIALGGTVSRGAKSYALTFEGPAVGVPVGRMMLRILLGTKAAACASDHSSGFHPTLPLHGLSIVAPSNDLRQVITILNRVGDAAAAFPKAPGIGAWSPSSVLLVGDRPSHSWPDTAPNYPFISAYRSGCSEWLAKQLEEADIGEASLYWVNGYNQAGERTPHEWIEALSPKGIITLGSQAQAWLDGAGLKATYRVHHPQYWKRFHSRDTYVLPRYILKTLIS